MDNPICILAGSREQYERWLDENGHTSRTAVYGYDRPRIESTEFSRVEIVGSFWERRDAGELLRAARSRERGPDKR